MEHDADDNEVTAHSKDAKSAENLKRFSANLLLKQRFTEANQLSENN